MSTIIKNAFVFTCFVIVYAFFSKNLSQISSSMWRRDIISKEATDVYDLFICMHVSPDKLILGILQI